MKYIIIICAVVGAILAGLVAGWIYPYFNNPTRLYWQTALAIGAVVGGLVGIAIESFVLPKAKGKLPDLDNQDDDNEKA